MSSTGEQGPRPVLIRCDVGPTLGIGHVMRTLALAEEFAARGHRVVYAADLESVAFAVEQVRSRGMHHRTPPSDLAGELALLDDLDPAVVVIDSYTLPTEVYEAIRRRCSTVVLVDGDPAGRPGDVIVEGNLGAETDRWILPDGGVRLAGLPYALLRADVVAHRPATPWRQDSDPLKVLAFFGGTDAFGAAPVMARALAETTAAFDLTLVAADPERRAAVQSVAFAAHQRLTVQGPTPRLADLVRSSDLVLSAAGSSVWELFCLGAACGLVHVASNQAESYRRVVSCGAAVGLGSLAQMREGAPASRESLEGLLADAGSRQRLRAAAWAMVDGSGPARVVDAVAARLSGPRTPLR